MEGKVYAQVYSLIRVEREGLIDALREFSRIGYDGVEIVSDNSGGLSLDEFQALLRELNLDVIAIHGTGSDAEIKMAKACGIRYLAFDAKLADDRRDGPCGVSGAEQKGARAESARHEACDSQSRG